MKRFLLCVIALSLLSTLTACNSPPTQAPVQGLKGNIPTEASLCGNAAEQESCDSLYDTSLYHSLKMGEVNEVEYLSLSEMLLAVNSGKADWMYVPYQTARYIQYRNTEMTLMVDASLLYYYSMLTRDTDAKLCQEIDGAIGEMRTDGSLDTLTKQYLYSGGERSVGVIKMPDDSGTKTIKIGVTGDFPPMDYIASDGNPEGFNVALCAAIGERLGVNIQLVSVTAEARLTALSSGMVDVLFWQQSFGGEAEAFDGVCVTQSYFRDFGAALTLHYSWEDIAQRYGLLVKETDETIKL
ncbi:transporter substrate-binding domain-containing protein [Anoxybacterium hadale]|uniref:Transporter substrate-binding domain-containing protein n=1 Tax=Anoxybacterium hadale TaxID=3408580 RepID=A0ACD1A9K4_9FIRM|nr:transporter substrate-binding domain-containing protein [Clostridiales bacterium]